MASRRVTVTLPAELVGEIDRREENRSRFILEAVERELARRRRAELGRSLNNPHPATEEVAELGISEWADHLPQEDITELVDLSAGTAVRWTPGEGWTEASR